MFKNSERKSVLFHLVTCQSKKIIIISTVVILIIHIVIF